MVLRPTNDGNYSFEVVGQCYFYGMMDAESLLGPISPPWKVQLQNGRGFFEPHYHDTTTDESILTRQDPRLEPLSTDWESIE